MTEQQQEILEPTTQLTIIENTNALTLYTGAAADEMIDKLEQEVANFKPDLSTEKGRKAIASFAHRISRAKVAMDKMGLALTEEHRAVIDQVNAQRNNIKARMDALRDKARAPLDEYEEKLKARVEEYENNIKAIEALAVFTTAATSAEIEKRRLALVDFRGIDWAEFADRATGVMLRIDHLLANLLETTLKAEADAAELAERRRQDEERAQRERDAEIARQAAEAARIAAEQAAAAKLKAEQEERERAEREKQEAEERAAAEKQRAEKAEADAKAAAEQAARDAEAAEARRVAEVAEAERQRKADAEAAEQRRIAEAEQAERDRVAAVEAERKRAADEQAAKEKREAEEKAKREADLEHKKKINNAAVDALVKAMIEASPHNDTPAGIATGQILAKAIVIAIASGKVPNVTISY